MPVLSLEAIIEKHGIYSDYISLDVEGYEQIILSDFQFEKFSVKVWVIEKKTGIKELMDKNGYVYVAEMPSNWIFTLKELHEEYSVRWYNHYGKQNVKERQT